MIIFGGWPPSWSSVAVAVVLASALVLAYTVGALDRFGVRRHHRHPRRLGKTSLNARWTQCFCFRVKAEARHFSTALLGG
jgi:hypothetical protein